MSRFLQRLFKIHRAEGRKVLHFALLGALLEAGIALGISTADSLFLVHVGARQLPVVYLMLPLIMVAFTPFFSYVATRYGIDAQFKITLMALAGGGLLCYLAASSGGGSTTTPFYVIKLYASLWAISLFTLYWNYVDRYFDMLDAKRLFSVFAGGSAFGAALGGGMVSFLARILPVEHLFLVWSLVAVASFPVVLLINRNWRKIDPEIETETHGFLEQTIEVSRIMNRSRYVVLLNLILVATVFLSTICEFQYLGVFSSSAGKEQLAVLFGTLFALTNVFNLIVNFFLFSRAVVLLGVRNLALVQPLAFFAAFAFLYGSYGWSAAVFGFFAYQGIQSSIDNNNWNFVMNGVPSHHKSQVRTFSEGISEPVAASLAGLFLFLGAPLMSHGQISLTGLAASLALVMIALFLRGDYLSAIMTNLKREWLDFSRSDSELLHRLDAAEIEELQRLAAEGEPEAARAAIRFMTIIDRRLALDSLLTFFDRARNGDRRKLHTLLSEIVQDADVEVLTTLVRALGRHEIVSESTFIEVLGAQGLVQSELLSPLLGSSDAWQRAAAAVARWNSWDLNEGVRAMTAIDELLSGRGKERLAGIRALGQMRQGRYAHFLVRFLRDGDSDARYEALSAIRNLVDRDSGHLVPEVLGIVRDGSARERDIAIDVLSKIKDSGCLRPLLSLDQGLTPLERRKVEKLILEIGLGSVPTIVAILGDPGFDYQARSIAARTLGKLAFPQFEALLPELIRTELERAYRYLYFHYVLRHLTERSSGIDVLSLFYRDAQQSIVEFVLEILTIGGRLPDFEMISSSLRSTSPRVRANAIESVEQACSRDVFKLLLPLVARADLEETAAVYLRRFDAVTADPASIVEQAVDGSFDLECSAAAQALWEDDPREGATRFATRLTRPRAPLFCETVLSLLERVDGKSSLNSIERIDRLSKATLFRRFGTAELRTFSRHSRLMDYFDGDRVYRRGQAADDLFVVLGGRVRLEGDGHRYPEIGQAFGEESLLGSPERREDAFSEGLEALVIDACGVEEEARRHPRIAIGLLETRLGVQ
jgi:HEAT repeat protein/MFS family permease